jgi:putative nucleotidyltransferase with HDIG domain
MTVNSAPDRGRAVLERLQSVREELPELQLIASQTLRDAVARIWVDCWLESRWPRLTDAPKSPLEPAALSLVRHTRAVTRQALVAAEGARDAYGLDFDQDLLVAAALLHDVSKLVEWEPADGGARATRLGELVQHAVYAAHQAWRQALPLELVHVIVSHTDQSTTRPKTWEAELVRYADLLDSAALHRAAERLP